LSSVTYTSLTVPSYPYTTGEWLSLQKEFSDNYDFKQSVTYRRYHLTTDNITGDFDWSSYTDYTIYADVQVAITEDPLVEAGMLAVGDAIIYLPTRIQRYTTGTIISNEFRPQIQDEIIQAGVTWKIDKIDVERFGSTEIYMKCYAKRRSSTQPESVWNSNYATNRGFS